MNRVALVLCCGLLALAFPAWSQEKKEARNDTEPPLQPIWRGIPPGARGKDADEAGVFVHLPPADKANGAAVVICPGGGYRGLAMSYEGHDVARWLNTLGVAGIVLKYRLAPKHQHPIPMYDAQRAIRFTRANAKEWKLDSDRVGILGFSAGGHLASTAGTHFDVKDIEAQDQIDHLSSRPSFMILAYPVITMTDPYTHTGSRTNLLGKEPDPKLIEDLSNEKQVTAKTPPTFLVHTTEDSAVPPENSALFYLALKKNKVPAELHIFEKGRHGLGMGPRDLPFGRWPELCTAWMQTRGLLASKRAEK
jgi:acetyl esterase/lipase